MPRTDEADEKQDRRARPVDENETKREGVLPPEEPEDVHGFDTRTASPQGDEPIHPDRKDLKPASKDQREGS